MVNHILSLRFTHLGIEQSRVSSFREFFATFATAQQPNVILTIDFSDDEIVLSLTPKIVAIRVDTRSSAEVRSFHEGLLDVRVRVGRTSDDLTLAVNLRVMILGHDQ